VSLPLVSRLPDPWRRIVDWAVTLAVAIGCVLAFEAEVAKPYRIPSDSMEPALHCARPDSGCEASMSDRVLVNRLAYDFGSPQRGQIVVFNAPPKANLCEAGEAGTTFVKRLIGLPGETVREDHHGFIWLRQSCDSRRWGAVPRSNLIGPVIFTYWPPGRISYHAGGW
jgi:signal peptidase I